MAFILYFSNSGEASFEDEFLGGGVLDVDTVAGKSAEASILSEMIHIFYCQTIALADIDVVMSL